MCALGAAKIQGIPGWRRLLRDVVNLKDVHCMCGKGHSMNPERILEQIRKRKLLQTQHSRGRSRQMMS